MEEIDDNHARTLEYLKKFDRKKILKNLVNNNRPVIFDIGANLGQSLKEFQSWWKMSQVHCFEPLEECWDSLEKLAFLNEDNNIFINKFAVGNISEKNKIFFTHEVDNTKGTSGFNKINIESLDSIYLQNLRSTKEAKAKIDAYKLDINHQRIVNVSRMDNYMEELDINSVDLVKIDTQGHEPEVLDGFGDKLKEVKVIIAELMFYDYYERSLTFSDLEKFLIPSGFQLYDINHIAKNPMNGRTDWVDVIYLNRSIS